MHKFNDEPGTMESVHTQDLSPEDTLTSWSLDDFLDNVPVGYLPEEPWFNRRTRRIPTPMNC